MKQFFDPADTLRAAKFATEQTQQTQTQMVRNWRDLMATGLNTFNQLLSLSVNAAAQMTQQQQQLLHAASGRRGEGGAVTPVPDDDFGKRVARVPVSRVALITGGIGGLGTAMSQRLAAQGHKVIATHLPQEKEQAEQWQAERFKEGLEVGLAECDVTDWDDCVALANYIKQTWGPVELLVNNAGITRDGTLVKMEPKQWKSVLHTNLDSMFYVTKQFIEDMLDRGFGRVVNISSVNGHKGQYGQTNYATAKRGVLGFTQALAKEFANTGVTINSVSPGYVGTPMVEAIREDIKQKIIDQIPLNRLAKPEEIANAVAFLLADNAEYITGADLSVNGALYLDVYTY